MAKYVVTGGAGFIGSHLVDALVTAGHKVVAMDVASSPYLNHGARYGYADVRDGKALALAFRGADGVFHQAALPRVQFSIEHPQQTHDVNVNGTLNVLEAARAARVKRVVYAASSSAYGDQDSMPLRERMLARPKSPYGAQKYMGEVLCRTWAATYGLETVCLRYFNVYGPRFDPKGAYALVIGKFLEQRKRGESMTICGDGEQTRDFTHVSDVVRANLLAMTELEGEYADGRPINIGAGRNVSVNDIARLIGGPTVRVPARPEPRHTLADRTLARELLYWVPIVSIEDGIAQLKAEMELQ